MNNTRAFGITSLAVMVVSVGTLGWVSYNLLPGKTSVAKRSQQPPSARAWLSVLGLDVDALAAAGVTAEQATVVLADLQSYFDESGTAMVAAIDAHNNAKRVVANDQRRVRAGAEVESGTLTTHAQTLTSAAADRDSRTAAAFAAATGQLPPEAVQRLTAIHGNRSREVPAAYKLVERTDAQWVALREALVAERQAAERGEATPQPFAGLLTDLRAEAATSAALTAISQNRAALQQALQ